MGSGNESARAVFTSICQEFKQQLNLDSLMVASGALYSAPNLSMLTNLRWLTRVPPLPKTIAATGISVK